MSYHNDVVYLLQMRDACRKVMEYTDGFTWEKFAIDSRTQDAVIRQLEILGEASNRISEVYRNTNPYIPWRDIKALRNVVIHEYDRVMPDTVWDVAQKDVPNLLQNIDYLLEQSQQQVREEPDPADDR